MRGRVKRFVPGPLLESYRKLRSAVGERYAGIIDREANRITGKEWLPPLHLRREVGELRDFERLGGEQVAYLKLLCDLQPHERVLDIGCGCGRVTMPLTRYLAPPGRYIGMDVYRPAIEWCSQHITRQFPNFTFFHADLRNQRYNPEGRSSAASYAFPLLDHSFDVIHLRSVFTHLKPQEAANYLREIGRLLAPGGRCLATFFLFNEEQVKQALEGHGIGHFFQFGDEVYRYTDPQVPELVCAYSERYVWDLLAQSGLRLKRPPLYGRWSGRPDGLSGQDILILETSDHEPAPGRSPTE